MDKLEKYITTNMDKIAWTRSQAGNADGTLGPYTIRLMAEVILIEDTARPGVWVRQRNGAMLGKLRQCAEEWFTAELVRLMSVDEAAESAIN